MTCLTVFVGFVLDKLLSLLGQHSLLSINLSLQFGRLVFF
jgi:hypothetical protein